jgi:heme/copper-type cytochrome/quinol oxidase subunit 2
LFLCEITMNEGPQIEETAIEETTNDNTDNTMMIIIIICVIVAAVVLILLIILLVIRYYRIKNAREAGDSATIELEVRI